MSKKQIRTVISTRYPDEKILSIIMDNSKVSCKVVSLSKLNFVWVRHYQIVEDRLISLKQQSIY